MSNLVLVTLSASHGSVTQTKAMLEGLGHTVTVVLSSSATTAQLINYDLIVWCRGADNPTYSAEVVGAVGQGIPLICSTAGGVTTFTNTPVQALGLITSTFPISNNDTSQNSISILKNHELVAGLGVIGSLVPVYPSKTYLISVSETKIISGGINIAASATDITNVTLALFPAGTITSQGNPLEATVSFVPWDYGINGYTDDAKEIMRRLIVLSIAVMKTISGVITDTDGNTAQRKVIAINLTTNRVSAFTESDISGAYSVTLTDDSDYAIICVDDIAPPMIYVG
jgi:hypothetical protein